MFLQTSLVFALSTLNAAPALAFVHNAPKATDAASDGPDATFGWTPKTTPAPQFSGHGSDLRLAKRQDTLLAETNICGYYSGVASDPFSCAAGNACYYNTINAAFGCCSTDSGGYFIESDCNYINTVSQCYDYANLDQCTGACAFSQDTCGSTAPYCISALLFLTDNQALTHFACYSESAIRVLPVYPSVSDDTNAASSTTTFTPTTTTSDSSTSTTIPSNPTSSNNGSETPLPTPSPISQKQSSHAGAIAGGVVGGLAVIGLAAVGAVFYLRNKKKNQRKSIMPEISQM